VRFSPMADHGPQHHDPDSRQPLYRMIAGLAALVLAVVIVISLLAITIVNSLGGARSDGPVAPDRSLPAYWVVRHGQTYTRIAARTGLSIDQLETFNPHQDPTALVPGQHIKLRLKPPAAASQTPRATRLDRAARSDIRLDRRQDRPQP
jgi:hypothetical protein